jgi:glycosyltransferase involved in cell wall biosynthesis
MISSSTPAVKYSIIVPAFNAETTLPLCLDALSRQTFSKSMYEIIVVDDGSSDDTAKLAQQFEILYFYQTNQGPAAARNFGAQAAAGEFILFTDADCIPAADWLEQMVNPFADPSVVGVKGAYATRQKKLVARFVQIEFEDRYDLLLQSRSIDMIDTYSAAFRKDVFLEIGSFDRNFPRANNEDTDLSYRLSAAGYKLIFNPKAVVLHHHPDELIKYLRMKFWRAYWRMIVYRRFPEKAIKDTYTPISLKMQTSFMALSLPLLLLAPVSSAALWLVAVLWSISILSTASFTLKALMKDKKVGVIAPGVIFLRSLVFAVGSLLGMARSFFFPGFSRSDNEDRS